MSPLVEALKDQLVEALKEQLGMTYKVNQPGDPGQL